MTAPRTGPNAVRLTVALEGWNAGRARVPGLLARTLRSLAEQLAGARGVELVAVLPRGAHADAALVRAASAEARILEDGDPTYYSAENRALAHARGDVVLFADSDVVYAPGWLAGLRRCFERPDVAFAVGNTRYEPGGVLAGALDFTDWAAIAPRSGPCDFFYANNFGIRRAACSAFRLPERVGPLHGGAERLLRDWFRRHRVRPWFCREALAYHQPLPVPGRAALRGGVPRQRPAAAAGLAAGLDRRAGPRNRGRGRRHGREGMAAPVALPRRPAGRRALGARLHRRPRARQGGGARGRPRLRRGPRAVTRRTGWFFG